MRAGEILSAVEKPSRYLGGEINSARGRKGPGAVAFCLAFPDAYEIGMSYLGLQILYGILKDHPRVEVERCFAPWGDMENHLRRTGQPLGALESGRALGDFDIVGFSLQYELSYTNVLNMLDLGGIPRRRAERRDHHPLVIAGGPCTFNPAPMTDFIDAFVIGEGEEVIREIVAAVIEGKGAGEGRRDILARLGETAGVYIPEGEGRNIVRKRMVNDLETVPLPVNCIVPLMKTVHDRAILEIARGCTRGCRFCQAGMTSRPVRERKLSTLLAGAEGLLASTGHEEISLLALSAGDYSGIEELLVALMERYHERRIAVGLPSLRVETLSRRIMENIRKVRMTSFTLAPEAGTQRLRDIVNKGNNDQDLLKTAEQVFQAGWKGIKLYYMIGLPGEMQEDLDGLVDLTCQVLKAGKNRGQITVGLSTFIPKPHTPFQWERQISSAETKERQGYLTKRLSRRNLAVKWHDYRMSLLEGIFSRGDARSGRLIERAFLLGCRFDGWSDLLRYDLWEEALRIEGINTEAYLGERSLSAPLPWQGIECGLSREFLLRERERAREALPTGDCRFERCQGCGVCVGGISAVIAPPSGSAVPSIGTHRDKTAPACRYRLRMEKTGPARFLSHLEVAGALIRSLRRAGVSFLFSRGFHPHPKISFAHASAVGMESLCEYADLEAEELKDVELAGSRINSCLPEGLVIGSLTRLPEKSPSLAESISGIRYEILLPRGLNPEFHFWLPVKIANFLQADSFPIEKGSTGGKRTIDLRPLIMAFAVAGEGDILNLEVRWTNEGSARPRDILTKVLGFSDEALVEVVIRKKELIFKNDGQIILTKK